MFFRTWKVKNADMLEINRVSWIVKNNHPNEGSNSPVPIDWVCRHGATVSSPHSPICYPPSGAPPLTRSLSSFREAAHAPPHHLSAATSSSSSSFSAPAAVNSRIPVCDSVHPLLFSSPALSPPSVHPFLSCVLRCQAQLDQACQPHHMRSLLAVE